MAGDVLLEIETDKATMDVEAQDDGKLAKITQQDGSKAVQVGSRIAVLAESGDDLSSLEIPPEDAQASSGQPARQDRPSPQEELSSGIDKTESSPSAAEAPPSSKPNADAEAGGAADTAGAAKSETKSETKKSGGRAQKQTYPLYPSVAFLLHEKGISKADADKIPASGPLGRLLKGDVLAYLGKIEKNYSADQSARIEKMGHMDLSKITLAAPPKAAKPAPAEAPAEPELPAATEIAMTISLSAVVATQKRVQDTLGIFLPLSVFIARASELANEELPLSKARKPTSNDLFNSVLGLDKVATAKMSRGHYTPQITGLPATPVAAAQRAVRKPDIIDLLTSRPVPKKSAKLAGAAGVVMPLNVFSVVTPRGDEKRAQEYLDRMKKVLEAEPGRLVL